MANPKFYKCIHTPTGEFKMMPEAVVKNQAAMRLGNLVYVEEPVESDDMAAAKAEYKSLTGKNPHYRWTLDKIKDKIKELTDVN